MNRAEIHIEASDVTDGPYSVGVMNRAGEAADFGRRPGTETRAQMVATLAAAHIEKLLQLSVDDLRDRYQETVLQRLKPIPWDVYKCDCGHQFAIALGPYGCPNCGGANGKARVVSG